MQVHFFASIETRIQELVSQGCDVVRLDIGSPDMPPHPLIIQALQASVEKANKHGYQPHSGPRALREAWVEMYRKVYGVQLDPDRELVPLIGSKEGIFNLMMALVNPGDVVLIPDPGYITYTRGVQFAGGEPYYLPLAKDAGYLPDLDSVPQQVLRRSSVLWLNYPNNPTAAIAPEKFFEQAIEFARLNDLLICHDAAYTQVTFDGYRAPSLLSVPGAQEVAVEFNTLSKSHNMAGWRVAAALGNSSVVKTLLTLKTNLDSSHFLPVMEAATVAMSGDQSWLLSRNLEYQQRRDLVYQGLVRCGLEVELPQASLYLWAHVPPGLSSEEFSKGLLENALVSVTPGTVFGAHGEGYFRISITAPLERLEVAIGRLERWMKDGLAVS